MENSEEIFHFLEDFSKRKPKTIPQELNEYLAYVARTGDPVYQWCHVKSLFKEKLLNVITEFYDTTPSIDIPPYPNVDPFNYDTMKNSLLERLDSFTSAPFTVQRICELLTCPRKQYNRVDKFMRAIEKNILVVSTREPGLQRHSETENGEVNEPIVNGSDNNSEYNVDVEMEDMSWKENNEQQKVNEPQPGSSETQISVDDIEARLKAKQDVPMDTQEKSTTEYESVTPPELNVSTDDSAEPKDSESPSQEIPKPEKETTEDKVETLNATPSEDVKPEEVKEQKTETPSTLVIPEIKVDDVEMTEKKIIESNSEKQSESNETAAPETKNEPDPVQVTDESSSDSKDETENKLISEMSTSSEESSSSSDNTDGNSNSPKTDEVPNIEMQEESNPAQPVEEKKDTEMSELTQENKSEEVTTKIESENYSISDVNSEIPQAPVEKKIEIPKEDASSVSEQNVSETKTAEDDKETKLEAETSETTDNKES